jgi:hypothetical protein
LAFPPAASIGHLSPTGFGTSRFRKIHDPFQALSVKEIFSDTGCHFSSSFGPSSSIVRSRPGTRNRQQGPIFEDHLDLFVIQFEVVHNPEKKKLLLSCGPRMSSAR